jgi:ATP phosphoribosyltransferase regulatory subunit HisZ
VLRASAAPAARLLLRILETGVPAEAGQLGAAAASWLHRLEGLQEQARERFPEIEVTIDLAEFAGFSADASSASAPRRSYYDGLLFRAYGLRGNAYLGGGGRYDRLFRSLGAEVPAAGFSLSLDRVLAALEGADG